MKLLLIISNLIFMTKFSTKIPEEDINAYEDNAMYELIHKPKWIDDTSFFPEDKMNSKLLKWLFTIAISVLFLVTASFYLIKYIYLR